MLTFYKISYLNPKETSDVKVTGACSGVSYLFVISVTYFMSLQATNSSYVKQYSNQPGLTEYDSGVRIPLPTQKF
jgi:hypothetical protein